MKSYYNNKYSDISSFEDFRIERERLLFKSMLIEAKLNLTFLQVRKMFSLSNLFFSFAKEAILPKISDFLGTLIKKVEGETDAEPAKVQEE